MSANSKIEWTDADLAYMAGLIDGGGTICVLTHATGKTCYPTVLISTSSPAIIEWVAERLGRTISVNPNRTVRGNASKMVRVSGKRAISLCHQLLPHLKAKRAQAKLVIQFPPEERRGRGVTLNPKVNKRRFDLRDKINAHNHIPRNRTYKRGA